MADLGNYDPNASPAVAFDPIPAKKDYVAMIVESDVQPTSAGTGEYLSLKVQIIDGEYQGRIVFKNINLRNASPKAQEIGQRELAALRLATGVNSPKASEEFHNIPMLIDVKVRPAGPDKQGVHRDAQNEIRGFTPIQQPQQAAPAQTPPPRQTYVKPHTQTAAAPQPVAAASFGGAGKPPWKR